MLFVLSLLALVMILKPFNKATVAVNHDQYSLAIQTDTSDGYVVDYNGVIDFVAYQSQTATAELFIKTSGFYRFKFQTKKSETGCQLLYAINGVDIDSFDVLNSVQVRSIKLRKGDYFKIHVRASAHSNSEVGVKFELSNSKNQLLIYVVILLYFLCGLILMYFVKGYHFVLPSLAFLLSVYNEHLYPSTEWIIPMIGFVFGFMGLALLRFLVSKFPIRFISGILVLIYDYLLLAVVVILAGFVWNYKRFGFRIDYDTIVAVLQSNISETLEFAISELNVLTIGALVLLLIVPFFLLWIENRIAKKSLQINHLIAMILSGLVVVGLIGSSNFLTDTSAAYFQYYEEIAKFNEVQNRFNQPKSITASKDETGETYIFVIGESQSKEHMSLYGYHRKTTPFLDSMNSRREIEVFSEAYSSHTHTIMVLQDALTQSNQYNGLKYTEVPSLINILNAADFETVWLSNQVKLSNWDNIVSAIASGCKKQIFVNKNIGEAVSKSPYDESLIPELEKILDTKSSKNKAIFIHLLGNHGKYDERYPASFKKLPSRGKSDFGSDREVSTWEAYDNSILYNDYVLGQIQDVLSDAPGDVKLMTYFADHAEDLSGGRGHNSGQFTYRMTQIPMFIWADKEYKERYPLIWDAVEDSKGQRFSNDLFFQLALSLTGVETPYYNPVYDLTDFRFAVDTFKTKGGRLLYDSPSNQYTNTLTNKDSLKSLNQLSRVGIHRVNSFGKLNEVQRDGFEVIELDIKIVNGQLLVGHGEDDAMSNTQLKDYLISVDLRDVSKVWLDIKNINKENLQRCIRGLNEIDSLFGLKKKLIVETSATDYNVSLIAQQGFDVSYYLPTEIAQMTQDEQRNKAVELIKQLKYQKVSSISFDAALYTFVKAQLQNQISPAIQYHTWNVEINIRHGDFLHLLQNEPYFQDQRVKTILVGYPSVFNL